MYDCEMSHCMVNATNNTGLLHVLSSHFTEVIKTYEQVTRCSHFCYGLKI